MTAPLPDERLTDEEREVRDALASAYRWWEQQVAARLAARTPEHEVERLRAALAEQSTAICFDTTCLSCGGYLGQLADITARIEQVRAYVDHPGNWSALDGRRRVILDLLDGREVPGISDAHGDWTRL